MKRILQKLELKLTMSTGRYWVVDQATGRTFCIEPIAERSQKIDGQVFANGGLDGESVKNAQRGGSIREEDSIITTENGYTTSITLPPGVSPNDYVNMLCKTGQKLPSI
jgi:hypothetical protein